MIAPPSDHAATDPRRTRRRERWWVIIATVFTLLSGVFGVLTGTTGLHSPASRNLWRAQTSMRLPLGLSIAAALGSWMVVNRIRRNFGSGCCPRCGQTMPRPDPATRSVRGAPGA